MRIANPDDVSAETPSRRNGDFPEKFPLNAMILGGAQVHEGSDYIVSLLTPEQVREVAVASAEVDQATLRAGFR